MKFDIEYIEKLAQVLTDASLTEISIEDGEQAITLRKDLVQVGVQSAPVIQSLPPQAGMPAASAQPVAEVKKGNAVTSPMVGTFYLSPSPDSKPFIEVGKSISKGEVVCIIEAMKLMNEIETEFSGIVTEICVKDGQPVEFGQVLMYVE